MIGGGVLSKKKKKDQTVEVLSHILVPEMKLLSKSEEEKILSQFSINKDQLPRITSDDPAVVCLKAEVGNIIRLSRDEKTGKYVSYRVVIE